MQRSSPQSSLGFALLALAHRRRTDVAAVACALAAADEEAARNAIRPLLDASLTEPCQLRDGLVVLAALLTEMARHPPNANAVAVASETIARLLSSSSNIMDGPLQSAALLVLDAAVQCLAGTFLSDGVDTIVRVAFVAARTSPDPSVRAAGLGVLVSLYKPTAEGSQRCGLISYVDLVETVAARMARFDESETVRRAASLCVDATHRWLDAAVELAIEHPPTPPCPEEETCVHAVDNTAPSSPDVSVSVASIDVAAEEAVSMMTTAAAQRDVFDDVVDENKAPLLNDVDLDPPKTPRGPQISADAMALLHTALQELGSSSNNADTILQRCVELHGERAYEKHLAEAEMELERGGEVDDLVARVHERVAADHVCFLDDELASIADALQSSGALDAIIVA